MPFSPPDCIGGGIWGQVADHTGQMVIVPESVQAWIRFSRKEWKPDQVTNRLDSVSVGLWSEAFRLAVQVDAFQTCAVFLCFNIGHGDWPCSFDRFHLRRAKFFWSCHCFTYWVFVPTLLEGFSACSCVLLLFWWIKDIAGLKRFPPGLSARLNSRDKWFDLD